MEAFFYVLDFWGTVGFSYFSSPPSTGAQGQRPLPESKVKPNSRFSRFQFLLLAKCRGLLNGSKQ
jgi:hypothetical protein